ncbi:class I SAM-dependent methyltransferase [Candidatus Woesebacteria bacterium]|nr:MAG: class I SAM-dependent methyltransferase [Candidatus Woesebacteria bacterium]
MTKLLNIATDPKQYDRKDVKYEGVKGLDDPHRKHFLYWIEKVHPKWKDKTVLDIGAGSGWLVKYVKEKGAREAVGFDPSSNNVKLAKENFDIELIESSLQDFFYPEKESFDTAIALYVLTHVEDLDGAFEKISEYLKSGGMFIAIISDPEYAKRPKEGVRKDIEYLKGDKYNTFIIRAYRKTGTIADIVRDPKAYIDSANKNGFILKNQINMKPSKYLTEAYEKHQKLKEKNVTLSQMLVFEKK